MAKRKIKAAAPVQAGKPIDFTARANIQAAAAEPGKPRRFSMTAYTGGAMYLGGWGEAVVIDLQGLDTKDSKQPICLDHQTDVEHVMGQADTVTIKDNTLTVEGTIMAQPGTKAATAVALADSGFAWQASIGARAEITEYCEAGATIEANGQVFNGPVTISRKTTLGEISFVALGADDQTSARIAAEAALHNQKGATQMTFTKWLAAKGFDEKTLTAQQTAFLKAQYETEQAAPTEPATPATDQVGAGSNAGGQGAENSTTVDASATASSIRAAAAAETDRIAQIHQVCGSNHTIAAQAIREGWTVAKAALQAHREERPQGPAIHTSTVDVSPAILEAAFSASAGLRNRERYYAPQTLEAAERYRNIGLQELILQAANSRGYAGRQRITAGNCREVLTHAFTGIQASGFSTNSVSGLLSNVANKLLLEGFNAAPQTWRQIARIRNVSDFKTVTAYRMTASLEYEELAPGGEIKHGTLGNESYTMAAKTYAKMLALTRTDIINDDLGAFDDLRNRLGLGAAIKLSKVFWTLWVNNSAFFTSGRNNLQSGAATALGEAGLNTAVKLFRDMTATDGNLLNLEPKLLVVPSDLEAGARKFYTAQEIRDTTATTKYPTANIYQNRFEPIVVPELSNSNYTGYSATAWYLLADPAVLATAAVCFLNGVEAPTIESADADFDTLGVQFRGYHDFGVAMTEYRAGVKSAGV